MIRTSTTIISIVANLQSLLPWARVGAYKTSVLMTLVTRIRKDAPGSLTAADVAAHFKRRGYPRKIGTITAFERGQIKSPPARFVELYAEAVGRSTTEVQAAHAATVRQRERKTGPFRP